MDILELVKNTLRIDGVEEDGYLNTLANAAKELLEEAGVKAEVKSDLYKIVVAKITTEWYINREINDKLPMGIIGMINQLRYKEGAK
ncbi:head-tail connector protein [Peptostreptococcus russellii]|uniref:head-tail connector protein n=1 Tax=Peptostreptococcus russellii TaxID=215200 RepID=UPI002942B00F|nr:head-tail connector protein [Peptostreptococcus russellii]